MKFTEEQAREALRAELTNNGRKTLRMSEKTLSNQTANMIELLADDEIGLPDFTKKALKFMNSINEDIGKDKSDNYKKVRKEVEEEMKESSPEDKPSKEDKGSESPELKALMERIASLEKDKAESEKKATITQRRKDLVAKLKEKGVNDDEWIELQLSKVNFDRELDLDAETGDYVKLYNKSVANRGTPILPGTPNDPPVNKQYENIIKAAGEMAKAERASVEFK